MSSDHVAAIVARIAGTGAQALNVYDSRPTSPTYPYVIVYAGAGVSSSDREADERIRRTVEWQTTVVGVSAAQCRAALDRVHARLENWTPVVAGWTASKVQQDEGDARAIKPDDSLPDRTVFYATDDWSSVFDPA